MNIPIAEFQFTFSRSSGAGGQNVNKVNTKVTLTWDMLHSKSVSEALKKRFMQNFSNYVTNDGLVKITGQRYRNQSRNIADCTDKLIKMLELVAKPAKKRIKTRPTKSSVEKRINNKKNKSKIKDARKKVDY